MREISSFEELDEVMGKLHDCPFDLPRARFDPAAQTWTGVFLRPAWEDPRAEHTGWLLFSSTRLPIFEATLTVMGVTEEILNHDQGIDSYDFNEVERVPTGVRLNFCERLSIDLILAGAVVGRYEENPLPGLVAVYKQRLLIQSGPYIESTLTAPAR